MGQYSLSSARVINTCRLKTVQSTMNGFSKLCILALLSTATAQRRNGKNLRGVFPFRQEAGRSADHHEHHEHHEHHHEDQKAPSVGLALPARGSRQGANDEVSLDIGSIAAGGERCIDKAVMVEETEYDDVITCKHSYSQKCHTTYTTDFEPQQEEECEENFIKNCFIE